MSTSLLNPLDTGLVVVDLRHDIAFASRSLHTRDVATQMEGMRLLTRAFVESPSTILQVLVNAAVDLCGADSAGISIEREDKTEENYYQWVATAGDYGHFTNAILPREPSACGQCLERGGPQLFRVTKKFFDIMGIEAAPVTDGLLLPWEVDEVRGTIWIMAHGRKKAFDPNDLRMMQVLADFAALATRHQRQQFSLIEQARERAASAMANDLAHQINNPLQSLTNLVYLAAEAEPPTDKSVFARELSGHLSLLSRLVHKLLTLPRDASDWDRKT